MGRTLREQLVTYVGPAFRECLDEVVQVGQAQEKRVTVSSICEEMMREGYEVVRRRYVVGSKPIRKARRSAR